jgi:hypothetical protein
MNNYYRTYDKKFKAENLDSLKKIISENYKKGETVEYQEINSLGWEVFYGTIKIKE